MRRLHPAAAAVLFTVAAGVWLGAPLSASAGVLAPTPGELTFEINRRRLAGGLAATDAEVRRAIAYAARVLKLVVEPGGAVALACILAGHLDVSGRTVAVVLSGGNIDDDLLRDVLSSSDA